MAIKKSFGGKTIFKPGSYSKYKVDNSGGGDLASNDTVLIVGEAAKGAPGSSEGFQSYSQAQLSSLVAKYGSGPIVDCALAASRPSRQPGIGGAGRIIVYKTNASTQASATLDNSNGDLVDVKDSAYGVDGNLYSVIVTDGTVPATQKSISISQLGGTTENLGENPGRAILTIQYTGDATTAVAQISGASRAALTLATTLAGDQSDGSVNLSITLKNYTMKQLVDYINAQTGYSASLSYVPASQLKANELDPIASGSILSAVTLRRLQYEIVELINTSARVEASLKATPIAGLPDNQSGLALTGGAQGASSNSNFSTAFTNSLAQDYNVLLPAISRDASDDIADEVQGFTDASSAYTIASVLAAMDTHLRLRGDVKNRREAQGMAGVRASTKAAAFASISGIGSELVQACMQDVLVLDETATLSWKHPHVMAAMAAGIRLGTEVGEPLTHKYLNANGVGHFVNAETGIAAGDFNPINDVDDAIQQGVMFAEPAQGGYRIVVDNTTYGIDDSFIFNRGSVIEASFFVFRTLREVAENVFIGKKVSNGAASSIKEAVRNKLRELNQPDVNIITSSSDAPEGYVEETFVVTVQGNTATVQVEFKPVQGLDFVFYDFTIGDISQQA